MFHMSTVTLKKLINYFITGILVYYLTFHVELQIIIYDSIYHTLFYMVIGDGMVFPFL